MLVDILWDYIWQNLDLNQMFELARHLCVVSYLHCDKIEI